jgi:hypothetical protein
VYHYAADTHVHVQRLVSVVKMPTVLEACTNKVQHSVVHFLWATGLNAEDIHREMFPVYSGQSRKVVYNWVANVSLMTKRLIQRC